MRLLKRALSVLLSAAMCIPTGVMNMAVAAEQTDELQSSYIVMLETPDNGAISFTGSDGDSMTVSAGSSVEVLLQPDEGYEVDELLLLDAATGKKIASKKTADNIFSFTMPKKDVAVDAEFIPYGNADAAGTDDLEDISGGTEDISNGNSDSKENASYEIVDEDDTEAETDDSESDDSEPDSGTDEEGGSVSDDAAESSRTTEYIAGNMDEGTVETVEQVSKDEIADNADDTAVQADADKSGLMPTAHTIMVNYNLVDASSAKLAEAAFDSREIISAAMQEQQIYAIDGNEDCFAAFIDPGQMNGIGQGVSASFSNSDTSKAVSYNDIITYDTETGIAYIPKSLFFNENGEEIVLDLQAQVFVPYVMNEGEKNVISLTVENGSSSVEAAVETQKIAVPSFDVTVTLPLVTPETAEGLDMKKVSLYINDSEKPTVFADNEYFFNKETGELTIAAMPLTVYSIRAVIEGETVADQLAKAVTGEAHADIGRQVRYESDIKMIPDVYLDMDYDSLVVNTSQIIPTDVNYYTNESIGGLSSVVRKYFSYLCYSGNNYTNSLWAAKAIYNGSAELSAFLNTDFGDATGTTLSDDMMELYNYIFTLPQLTDTNEVANQKLPLHSIMLFQGMNAENDASNVVAADLAGRPLRQEVVVRLLHKDIKNGIPYGVFGFAVATTDGNVAAYGIYKIPINTPAAYIQIKKESKIPGLAEEDNKSYTYEGAQFQIYNGSTLIEDVNTGSTIFTLDASGVSDVIAVPIPTSGSGQSYTIKEIKAPTGYKAAPDQTVSVYSHHTYDSPCVVTFSEEPYTYDADIIIDKLDKISTYSGGDASLAGIKFEVLYYSGYGLDSFASLSGEPTRTWTIGTKERYENEEQRINMYGHAELQDEYIINGESDELYYDTDGNVVLPLGTYVVREKDAGDGYKISGEMYVMQDNIKEPNFANGKTGTDNPAEGLIFMVKANIPETPDYRSEIDSTGNRLKDYEVYKTTGYIGATSPNGVRLTNIIKKNMVITATNSIKYGGMSLQKWDINDQTRNPQGNAESMAGRYCVKNISDHPVTIKSENGISINTGFASKTELIDGIYWYTFDPVAPNNMSGYMFTFSTNSYGFWQSSKSLLPYGTYQVDELIPPKGYQKNGIVSVQFEVREDGEIVQAPNIQNMIDRGSISLVKFDADDLTSSDQGSGTLQGTYTIKNLSAHYVWILDHHDGAINILMDNIDKEAGAVEVTGEGTWYKFAPGVDMFTFTTKRIGDNAAMYISDPYLLPYGTYEIRETGTTDSYIISDIRNGRNKATFSITYTGDIAEFGTKDGIINDESAIFTNPVARGGFKTQKNDADRKDAIIDGETTSRKAQGDATFENAAYKITTNNDNYVWIKDTEDITVYTENAVASRERDGEMWYKFTNGSDMCEFKVDADGNYTSAEDMLPYGHYTITEVRPSEGYLADDIRDAVISVSFEVTAEGQVIDLTYAADAEDGEYQDSLYEAVIRGGVKMQKNDADVPEKLSQTAQGDATFEGAEYSIYNISDSYVWVDTNGDSTYSDDEYYKPADIDVSDVKSLSYEDVAELTPLYKITTDADGFASTGDRVLPYGTYLMVETKASDGYLMDAKRGAIVAHTFEIREEGVIVDSMTYDKAEESGDLTNTFFEAVKRGGFDFYKKDDETKKNVALGGTNLEGTFTVTNISNSYVWIKDEEGITLKTDGENHFFDEKSGYHLYEKNEVMFTFTTDAETGKFETSAELLPYGTYRITEVTPPNGYLMESNTNPEMSTVVEIREDGSIVEADIYNLAMRGDFNFEKKDAETGTMMQYIPFLITSLDQNGEPIESHVVYTGVNGNYSTEADFTLHTYKTNKMDETIEDVDRVLELLLENDDDAVEELLKDGDFYSTEARESYFMRENYGEPMGVWFGIDTEPVNFNRTENLENCGALPFGRYRIDELPCESNKGKLLVHNHFTILTEANRTTALNNPLRYHLGYKSAGIISYGTIYNWEKPLAPQMTTSAKVRASDTQFSGTDSTMVIVDTVHYQGIEKNKDYTLVTMVADAVSGEYLRDATGNIAMTSQSFMPNTTDSYIEAEISVDTTGYEGKTVVVYETLYDEEGNVYIDHCNPDDEKQQIHFPSIDTIVTVESTQKQVSGADEEVTVIDGVAYSNLSIGANYSVKSYLADAETGAVIVDAAGNRIESEQAFKPTTESGIFETTFTFDATKLAGKKVIVCEEIVENGYVISSHKDIHNDKQAVWFPALATQITDEMTGSQMSFAEDSITVTDTVSYTMVQPNLPYTVRGVLVDAETGEEVASGQTAIIPTTETGTAEVTFNFDGTGLDGKTLVSCVTMDYEDVVVGTHDDMEDEKEMVHIPGISTAAADSENKFRVSKADDSAVIVDTVEYKNLMTGYDYIASGYLVDKKTGSPVEDKDGNLITAETPFTPEDSDGSVDVTFELDASSMAGKTVVVYETINAEVGEGVPVVGEHADAADENQTIHFPKLTAHAHDKSNLSQSAQTGETVFVDTVTYNNLIPGADYTLVSKLIVKETKEILQTKTVDFTASGADGTIDVEYTVDTDKYAGKTLVFAEDLQYDGFSIASIDGITNESSAVHIAHMSTSAVDGENGTKVSYADESVTITDTVTYKNLIPGMQYVMFGRIIDQATGEPLESYVIDEPAYTERGELHEYWVCNDCEEEFESREAVLAHLDNSECTDFHYVLYYDKIEHEEVGHYGEISAVKPFVASADGTVVMEFNFDGTLLADKVVTVYEDLYMVNDDGVVLTEHYDCRNCDAKYNTLADVENHFRESQDGCDTYSFKYTPDMFHISSHNDRYDDAQTVYIPALTNEAAKKKFGLFSAAGLITRLGAAAEAFAETTAVIPSGNHYVEAGKDVEVKYTVKYSSFQPGQIYDIRGILVDKETGADVGVSTVIEGFQPDTSEGTFELTYKFNSTDFAGMLLIPQVYAYINGTDMVASLDIDGDPTIYVVSVDTNIEDNNTNDNTAGFGVTKVTDVITISGLKPETEYTATGTLMNPVTGEEYKNIPITITIVSGSAPDIVVDDEIPDEDVNSITYTPTKEDDKKNILEWLYSVTIGKLVEPTTKTSVDFATLADTTTATVKIEYEIDTRTMAGESVVSFVRVTEKETGNEVGKHEDMDDEDQTLHVASLDSFETLDAYTGMTQAMLGKTVLNDKVKFTNLVPGRTYNARANIVDAETNEVLARTTKEIVPEESEGMYGITFYVDSTKIVGKTIIITEELYLNGVQVAFDQSTDEQKIHVASIVTDALSEDTNTPSVPVAGRTTIVDTITYDNLVPGKTYVATGKLVNKETEGIITVYDTESEGNDGLEEISVTFTPEKSSGTVRIPFSVNTSDMSGDSIVAMAKITYSDWLIAEHNDILDIKETTYIPTLESRAADKTTGTLLVSGRTEATIIDTVKAGNLVVGQTYTASASLISGATGETVATATGSFEATAANMTIELELLFNADDYIGDTFICTDSISINGVELISSSNEGKIRVGSITTSVRDRATGIGMAEYDIDTKVIDTVKYTNFIPGLEYTIRGELVSKKTGKVLDSKTVTKVFEEAKGEVDVEFEIDTTAFDGRQFVALETIYCNGAEVASHTDMEDDAQTMNVAEIGTEAFINGEKEVPPASSTLLVDTVNYANLRTGYEYDMIGTLIDVKTGQVVACNDIPVTSTVSFVADESEGVVNVPFTFDTTDFEGRTIVVYEELRYNNVLIAEHRDINSAKQTVTITKNASVPDVQDAKVIVRYVDTEGNEISASAVINGKSGDAYKAAAKSIEGYKLTRIPDNASGTMAQAETVVTYIYEHTVNADETEGIITVKCVDGDGKAVADVSIIKEKLGNSYSINAPTVRGYKLVKSPENAKGTVTEKVEVVFVYQKDVSAVSTITVRCTDTISGKEITEPKIINGTVGESYTIKAPAVKGWKLLDSIPSSIQVKMEETPRDVKFIYEKTADASVTSGSAITISKVTASQAATMTVNKPLKYTVTLTASKNDAKNVVVKDAFDKVEASDKTLAAPNAAINQDSVVIKDINGNLVKDGKVSFAEDGSMTITFPSIAKNQAYTITYTAMTTDKKLAGKKLNNVVSVSADNTEAVRQANAKVTVAAASSGSDGKDDTDKKPGSVSGETVTKPSTNTGSSIIVDTDKNNNGSQKNPSSNTTVKDNTVSVSGSKNNGSSSSVAGSSQGGQTGTTSRPVVSGTNSTVSSGSSTLREDGVKTGDYYAAIIIVILLAASAGIGGFIFLKKKKK